MPITDSINLAKQSGASDKQILEEIIKQNPQKADIVKQALSRGADESQILGEITLQNTSTVPAKEQSFLEKQGFGNDFGSRFLENLGPKGMKEFADFPIGAAKGVASTVSGASELGQEIFEGAGELVGIKAPKEKAALPKALTEATTPEQEFGKAVEQVAEFFIPVGKGLGISKLPRALEATRKASSVLPKGSPMIKTIDRFLGKTPDIIARAINDSAGVGIISALQAGDLKEGGKVGAVAGGLSLGSGVLGRVARGASSAVAARAIPTTITQRGKDAARGLNIGEAIGALRPSLTRKSLQNKLESKIGVLGKDLGMAIDVAVNKNKTSKSINEVVRGVEKSILDDVNTFRRLKATPIDKSKVKEVVKEVVGDYKKLYKGKSFNEKDLQALKVALGDGLESEFSKAVGATTRAKPLTEMKIRANLQTMIEDLVPETAEINKKLAPLFESSKRLRKKGAYSGYLTDMVVGSMASGGSGGVSVNPAGFVGSFLKGVILKRALTSTASKTTTAYLLRKIDDLVSKPRFAKTVAAIGSQILPQN